MKKILGTVGTAGVLMFLLISSRASSAIEDQDSKARSIASYAMGVVFDLQGQTDKAIESFSQSVESEENYAAHLRLGADYARLGKLPEATKELNLVLESDPGNVQARYLLALIYSTQKDFDRASQEYEKILNSYKEIEPENLEIYGYLAQLYYSQKQYNKAIEQFERIIELDPTNVDVMFLLGSLYLELHDDDKAIEVFSRALKVDPDYDTCLNSLGYIYAEKGIKLDEALNLVEKAVEIDPENGAYLDSLGWVYFKKGNYAEALKYLQKADRYLKDPVIYEHLGDVYQKMNNMDEAKKYWSLSLELLPEQKNILEKLNSVQ